MLLKESSARMVKTLARFRASVEAAAAPEWQLIAAVQPWLKMRGKPQLPSSNQLQNLGYLTTLDPQEPQNSSPLAYSGTANVKPRAGIHSVFTLCVHVTSFLPAVVLASANVLFFLHLEK